MQAGTLIVQSSIKSFIDSDKTLKHALCLGQHKTKLRGNIKKNTIAQAKKKVILL